MSTLTVLTVGVCLVFGLQAADWSTKQQAAHEAMQHHDYNEAARLFDECVALSKDNTERVAALASYGIALSRADRNQEAKAALEQAMAEWNESIVEGKAAVSFVLAAVDRSLGDYQGAERMLRTALGAQSGTKSNRLELLVALADLLREEARGTEARMLLSEASHMTGLTPPERTNLLMETAELDLDLHLCAESRELWNEISEIGGTGDSLVEATVDGGLGESWMAEGNLARAEPLLRRSLQLFRNDPGSSSVRLANALAAMGRLYLSEDKLALADEALSEAIAKDEASLSAVHPQIAALLELRAIMLSRHGEAQEARDALERARTIMASHFGPESIAVAVVFAGLGEVELRANQPGAAVLELGTALRLFRAAGAENTGPGTVIAARYGAALKAAKLSAKTTPDEARVLLTKNGSQSFREK
jgi:tetratricopeptide (TPR) repeat protein